jgi:predicted extracellular nuclease
LEGVLDFAFGDFRIHPTEPVRFEPAGPRPEKPPTVRGTLRVVAWNLANYFNGDGHGGGFPTRGARNAAELERQRAKLVATLVRMDPDVAALVELENDGAGPASALDELVQALNEHTHGAAYAAIEPSGGELGGQAIAVGLLYRSSAATPIGDSAILDASAHPDFDSGRNRPSLAQTFEARNTGERVTVIVNHFKSKGSPCDSTGDPDLGDGQGNCNATRQRAASALVEWLATGPMQANPAPALVLGDLNAYPQEDPVRAIEAAGFVDLLAWFAGPDAYTYVYDGAAGRLDHALASADLLLEVGGAAVWHTNSDAPRLLDYRLSNPQESYAPDPFRASDHDPVLVGLFPDSDGDRLTDARDSCPHSAIAPTVTLADCDSGVPEFLDPTGCTLTDHLLAIHAAGSLRSGRMREAGAWLTERVDEGTVARSDRGKIFACVARLR